MIRVHILDPPALNSISPLPRILVVMGVSGSGKSTIGKRLAERIKAPYFDADAFHAPESIAKMSRGVPLTEADRMPWLARIAAKIDELRAAGESGVFGCSALKRKYRDILIGPERSDQTGTARRDAVTLIYLKGSFDVIDARIRARQDHFMPASLLQSQFDQLEEPTADERPVVTDIAATPDEIVAAILRRIGDHAAR